MNLLKYGLVRVGAAVPEMRVADCESNTQRIIEIMEEAAGKDVYLTVFPSSA